MSRIVFDIETNGLLDVVNTVHCVALFDLEGDENVTVVNGNQIEKALVLLMEADEIIGHNIIAYDIPAIQKVYPWFLPRAKITDTLVLCRLVCADIFLRDCVSVVLPDGFKKSMWGSHSLKAWGMRLGDYKGDYDGGWETWSTEMSHYCGQDVEVTKSLYEHLMIKAEGFSNESLELEHRLASICFEIGNTGWNFDVQAAQDLYAKLLCERIDLEKELATLFEPWEVKTEFLPKRDNSRLGYKKDQPFIKTKVIEFNPNSRKHIHFCLVQKYGWSPDEYTPSGDAKVDESVLSKLEYPEAQKLARFMLIQKRIAQLAEGSQAWLKLVDKDGKLRHTIISGGTISGRASARNPNLQQVVNNHAPFGKQMRALFGVPPGWTLCTADLQQLELRCLAHFLPDDGEYARQIEDGDIHTYVQQQAGLPDRASAKRFSYSLLYGGGDALIGSIVGGSRKEGKFFKEQFEKNVPSFHLLKLQLKDATKRGYLFGLDKRKLFIREERKALSQLLQSAGALLSKKWLLLVHDEIKRQQLSSYIVAWVHDEISVACPTLEEAQHVGSNILVRLSEEAGIGFGFQKIKITSEYGMGNHWGETH